MAAEIAARAGQSVLLLDQRRSPGRKFILAGRGGLNMTHSEPLDQFLDRYGPERAYLEPIIRGFGPDDLCSWAEGLGEPPFIGTSGRVFPQSFRAVPLLRAWLRRLRARGVRFHGEHEWLGWDDSADRPSLRFRLPSGAERLVEYDAAVLALGGPSWPRVGSDGSWVEILRRQGVDVTDLQPANCGVTIRWSAPLIDRFAGEPLKNTAVIVDGHAVRGDPVISTSGLEGGPIYAHSRKLRERIRAEGSAQLTIDLMPDLELGTLVRRLAERRQKKKSLSTWLSRSGIHPGGIGLMREATNNSLPTTPDQLAELAKAVTFRVDGLSPMERAISCAGGVTWSAVADTLQLHAAPHTYVVGEMLDWEAPTGGYLLQAVLSTGHHVGSVLAGKGMQSSHP